MKLYAHNSLRRIDNLLSTALKELLTVLAFLFIRMITHNSAYMVLIAMVYYFVTRSCTNMVYFIPNKGLGKGRLETLAEDLAYAFRQSMYIYGFTSILIFLSYGVSLFID